MTVVYRDSFSQSRAEELAREHVRCGLCGRSMVLKIRHLVEVWWECPKYGGFIEMMLLGRDHDLRLIGYGDKVPLYDRVTGDRL